MKDEKKEAAGAWYYAVGAALPAALILIALSSLLVHFSTSFERARMELDGMAYIDRLQNAIVLLQEIRGLAQMKADVTAKAEAFESAMAEITDDRRARYFGLEQGLSDVARRVAETHAAPEKVQTFEAYTAAVRDLYRLVLRVADRAALVTEPELEAFHLMQLTVMVVPEMTESVGRLRAYGSGLLGAPDDTAGPATTMAGQIAVVERSLEQLRLMRRVEGVERVIGPAAETAEAAAEEFLHQASAQVSGAAEMSAETFFDAGTAAIGQCLAMGAAARASFERILRARVEGMHRQRALTLVSAFAALVAMIFFHYRFYLRNEGAFQRLRLRENELRNEVARHTATAAALRASEAKWRALVTNAPDVIADVARDYGITFINRVPDGMVRESVIGSSVFDHINPGHRRGARRAIDHVFRTGLPGSYEIESDAGGTRRWYSTRIGPVWQDGRIRSVTLITRDITERRDAERRLHQGAVKLAQQARHLRRVNEELEQFAYVVSHDLKAPLRAIAGLSSVLEEELADSLSGEQRRLLHLLQDRVVRMHSLIEALLLYAQADDPGRSKEANDVPALVRRLVDGLDIPEGFDIAVSPGTPAIVANPVALERVIVNLVANAVEHHDRDHGHIWIDGRRLEGGVELTVSDDGPGIDLRYREKVFEVFQSLRERPGHTGIGLALVRKILEVSGGHVTLEPRAGRGTTFRLFWADPLTSADALVSDAPPVPHERMASGRERGD